MTVGVGRQINLNFTTLAELLNVARSNDSFAVKTLVEATGFHENKVKGHQSWARAMGLIQGTKLTPLAYQLLERDPSLAQPLSRGICYVELAANRDAEVAYHICRVLLPRIAANGGNTNTKEIVAMLIGDGIGVASKAIQQPQRDASLFLTGLHSVQGFGVLGLLHQAPGAHYSTGLSQLGPELTGYALRRWWPSDTAYLKLADVHLLLSPLLLHRERFLEDLAALERLGSVIRITSSGLDQVRPVAEIGAEEVLWKS
jgi:hypothetical protein